MFCEDKLPESTGDKLTAWGDEFQLFWGNWVGLFWGVLMRWGNDSIKCLIYRRGTIFRSRLPGMLVKNAYILLENVEICGRTPNFLKVDINFAWGECTDLLTRSLWN